MARKRNRISLAFVKYLIIGFIAIISFHIAQDVYTSKTHPKEPVRYEEGYSGEIHESEYIISEAMLLSKLQAKSEIVSFQEDIQKSETHVDESFFGDRHTEIEVSGTYKMGLSTEDIKVKHIDSANRTVFIELPDPIIVSLDLPYDQVNFDKSKGWLRMAMSEEEENNYYKSVKKQIREDLLSNEDILRKARLHNEDVVKGLITSLTDIKTVVFE